MPLVLALEQVVIPTVLIVYIGMMSAFLSADDHSGDRAALLSVSILICMVNLRATHDAQAPEHSLLSAPLNVLHRVCYRSISTAIMGWAS